MGFSNKHITVFVMPVFANNLQRNYVIVIDAILSLKNNNTFNLRVLFHGKTKESLTLFLPIIFTFKPQQPLYWILATYL